MTMRFQKIPESVAWCVRMGSVTIASIHPVNSNEICAANVGKVGGMMSDQAELMAIYRQLTSALIEATPEWWSHATLELVAPPEGLGSGLSHAISNSDYPQDVVVATDEILESTRLLELDSVKRADSWNRCVFRIKQVGDAWSFSADYERN